MSKRNGRKRKHTAKPKLIPGMTWKHVMQNIPITRQEKAERAERKPARVTLKCRACFATETIRTHGSICRTVRCQTCGGVLDPVYTEPGT